MSRLLFLRASLYCDPTDFAVQDRYRALGTSHTGHLVAVVNTPEFRRYSFGGIEFIGLYLPRWIRRHGLLRRLVYGLYVMAFALRERLSGRGHDVVVAPDPLATGAIAVLVAWLIGARSIVEVNGNYEAAIGLAADGPTRWTSLRRRYVRAVMPALLRRADGVKLLYPGQVDAARAGIDPGRLFAFADFVPVARVQGRPITSRYVLFLGYPWYLKGVDTLILAFRKIRDRAEDCTLKVVGHCPDKRPFLELAAGDPRIELCDAVPYREAIDLIGGCALFVLPSRTEAMGRVLLEAMAAGKPIIASAVDGIPHVIEHGVNGLLFRAEDVDDLAEKMLAVLSDPGLAERLAAAGKVRVRERWTEARYVEAFSRMIAVVTGEGAGRTGRAGRAPLA